MAFEPPGALAWITLALHRAVVTLGSPVGEKILHRIALARLPELIGLSRVARDQGIEEMLSRLFFWIVAERIPQRHNRDQRQRRDSEGHGSGFGWFIGRWIEKCHSLVSCPASMRMKCAVASALSLPSAATIKS